MYKSSASLSSNSRDIKAYQNVQGSQHRNEIFSLSNRPEIRNNFREAPNVSLKYRYEVQDNIVGTNDTRFVTNAPSIEFDAYIWKSLTFITDFTYTEQDDGNQKQAFRTWDASLSYRKNRDAKWEYQLKASNLLNIDSNISNGAGSISAYSSETFVQPRFITFRLTYTL